MNEGFKFSDIPEEVRREMAKLMGHAPPEYRQQSNYKKISKEEYQARQDAIKKLNDAWNLDADNSQNT